MFLYFCWCMTAYRIMKYQIKKLDGVRYGKLWNVTWALDMNWPEVTDTRSNGTLRSMLTIWTMRMSHRDEKCLLRYLFCWEVFILYGIRWFFGTPPDVITILFIRNMTYLLTKPDKRRIVPKCPYFYKLTTATKQKQQSTHREK